MAQSVPSSPSGVTPRQADSRVPLVVFRVDSARYALSLASVERVFGMVAVAALPKAPAVVLGVVNIHGALVPVLDIRARFGLPRREWSPSSHLLVARTPRRMVALPVDEVIGVIEVSEATVIPPDVVVPGTSHVSGLVALPDGLLFIQDLDAFLSLDEGERLERALGEAQG